MKNLFSNLFRLFPSNREKSFLLIDQMVGYRIKNKDLFILALTHKSSPIVEKGGKVLNNERLEFLGDAILDAVVADMLYEKFPNEKEGFLTNIKSRIVNRAFLNSVAAQIGLDGLIKSTSNNHQNSILGNALEALIGAVYIDTDYYQCKMFITNQVLSKIDDINSFVKNEINFKSRLLEWSQKNKKSLRFDVVSETVDKTNTPTFISEVKVDGVVLGKGKGTSKKESHQDASKKALKVLKKQSLV